MQENGSPTGRAVTRREVLRIFAVTGAGLAIGQAGCRSGAAKIERSRTLMGTYVKLTVLGDDREAAAAAADATLDRMSELEALLSRYVDSSEVSRLAAAGRIDNASDALLEVLRIARDVSERVQAQQELQQSEDRYRVVAEASRDLISEVDAEGRLVYVSPTCKDVLGYDPEEVVGTTPFALVHPDDIERAVAVYLSGVETELPQTTAPFRVRHRDGSWRWLDGGGTFAR